MRSLWNVVALSAPQGSLYERLGGTPKVTAFVNLTNDEVNLATDH